MPEVERLLLQEGGETYEIFVESQTTPVVTRSLDEDDDRESYGLNDVAATKMEQARRMMRGYILYALSAFRDLGSAEIEEINLTFGLKLGGKAGIPYITEGQAESNLAISVRCKLPKP